MSESNQGVADYALTDPTLPGWNESGPDDKIATVYWWARIGPFYSVVQPDPRSRKVRYVWWISQGIGSDPDDDTRMVKMGNAPSPEGAIKAATTFFNRTARHIRARRK